MREQAMKLQKVKRSCRTAKKISKGIAIFLIAITILCIAGAAVCFVFRGNINPAMAEQAGELTFSDVNVGGILSFNVDTSGLIEAGKYAEVSSIYCVIAVVICAICAMVFGTLSRVFLILEKSETPFSEEVLKKMKTAFILLVVVVGLLVGLGIAVIIGLCLWCIYCILDYGVALQMEVDDTI